MQHIFEAGFKSFSQSLGKLVLLKSLSLSFSWWVLEKWTDSWKIFKGAANL